MAKIQISDLVVPKECESYFAKLKDLTEQELEQELALVKGGLAISCACACVAL